MCACTTPGKQTAESWREKGHTWGGGGKERKGKVESSSSCWRRTPASPFVNNTVPLPPRGWEGGGLLRQGFAVGVFLGVVFVFYFSCGCVGLCGCVKKEKKKTKIRGWRGEEEEKRERNKTKLFARQRCFDTLQGRRRTSCVWSEKPGVTGDTAVACSSCCHHRGKGDGIM